MKIVAQVKLLPRSAYDADAMAATLRACNRGARLASEIAFRTGKVRRNDLQDEVYYRLKAEFDLGAQAAVRTVKKVCDAYATLAGNIRSGRLAGKARRKAESKPIGFREDAAQPFDDRMLTWNLDDRTVSIWTVAGRIKGIPFVCSPQALELLASRKGESDLVLRDGQWFVYATVELLEPPVFEPTGWIGVDLGIVNIATTSDGRIMSGRRVDRYRKRMRATVANLQAKRTKSAKRRLKALRRRESRFATDTNHCVSKTIVTTAGGTSRPKAGGGSRNIAHRADAVWQRGRVNSPSTVRRHA
ncbi:putative transposase [Kitasatospora sp. MAP12-15]|uniref:transposase n=1 Tax=unclassified Kitasatospora TaxID=2633591 RepID=UPI003512D58C